MQNARPSTSVYGSTVSSGGSAFKLSQSPSKRPVMLPKLFRPGSSSCSVRNSDSKMSESVARPKSEKSVKVPFDSSTLVPSVRTSRRKSGIINSKNNKNPTGEKRGASSGDANNDDDFAFLFGSNEMHLYNKATKIKAAVNSEGSTATLEDPCFEAATASKHVEGEDLYGGSEFDEDKVASAEPAQVEAAVNSEGSTATSEDPCFEAATASKHVEGEDLYEGSEFDDDNAAYIRQAKFEAAVDSEPCTVSPKASFLDVAATSEHAEDDDLYEGSEFDEELEDQFVKPVQDGEIWSSL